MAVETTSDYLRDKAIADELATAQVLRDNVGGYGTEFFAADDISAQSAAILRDLRGTDSVSTIASSDAPAPPNRSVPAQLPTWDETPWYSKAWTYVTSVVPGAVADTAGVSGRPGAKTPADYLPDASSLSRYVVLGLVGLGLVAVIVASSTVKRFA